MRRVFVKVVFSCLLLAFTGDGYAIEADQALGKAAYQRECAVCHGPEGKGDGPAARFLDPKPRDFTQGIYKLRSTPTLPTDEDLQKTIEQGIPGTLMPSFAYLKPHERQALVAYLKSLSDAFQGELPDPVSIPDPPAQAPELLLKGKQIYTDAGCLACHGPLGKGDGPSAAALVDDWGNPILPTDLTVAGKRKAGSSARDVYRTLKVGIGGTPMPSYADALEKEEDFWALAYYVLSLSEKRSSLLPAGNPTIGRELFVGMRRFQNNGSPCIACHSVAGIGALGGGTLGPDLSPAFTKFGMDGIRTILTDLPFPTMNSVVSRTPLTQEEQAHLIGFLRSVSVSQRPPEAIGRLALLALGGVVLLLVPTHLIWRRRLTGVRRSLVERSSKRQ